MNSPKKSNTLSFIMVFIFDISMLMLTDRSLAILYLIVIGSALAILLQLSINYLNVINDLSSNNVFLILDYSSKRSIISLIYC